MHKKSCLPWALSVLLAMQPLAGGQQSPTQSLRVVALAGDGEVNDMERGIMAPLVVQVLDQYGRPVEGAEVVFRFPSSGPGVNLPDQKNAITTKTNADGQAAALGWRANGQAGSFEVRIEVTRGTETGSVTATMLNVARTADAPKPKQRKGFWSSKWVKIGLIAGAAGAAAAIILANRGSDETATVPTVVISPGSPTIGGPR